MVMVGIDKKGERNRMKMILLFFSGFFFGMAFATNNMMLCMIGLFIGLTLVIWEYLDEKKDISQNG